MLLCEKQSSSFTAEGYNTPQHNTILHWDLFRLKLPRETPRTARTRASLHL